MSPIFAVRRRGANAFEEVSRSLCKQVLLARVTIPDLADDVEPSANYPTSGGLAMFP